MANFGRDDSRPPARRAYGSESGFRSGFNRGGGGRSFGGGGRSSFGDRQGFDQGRGRGGDRRGNREMFKTTCSNCGKDCEVPFRPTNGKPVYCSDCFEKMGGGRSDAPRNDFRSPSPTSNQNNIQLDAVNAKLDKILAILEPKKVKEVKEVKTPKVRKVVKKSSVKK